MKRLARWTKVALAVALAMLVFAVSSGHATHGVASADGVAVAKASICLSEHGSGDGHAPGGHGDGHDCASCAPCCHGVTALEARFVAAPTPTLFARSEPRAPDLLAPVRARARATLARGPPSLS